MTRSLKRLKSNITDVPPGMFLQCLRAMGRFDLRPRPWSTAGAIRLRLPGNAPRAVGQVDVGAYADRLGPRTPDTSRALFGERQFGVSVGLIVALSNLEALFAAAVDQVEDLVEKFRLDPAF